MHQQQTAFENIVGKGEIAHYEQFLLFPQCFLLNQITVSPFTHIFDIISLFAAECEKHTIGISGKGLKVGVTLRIRQMEINADRRRTDRQTDKAKTISPLPKQG